MSSILKTPTLLAPPARESKRGQQSLETQRARALRVFYAALADRRSNPCNIVVMGDSMTEGQGATAWGNRWVDRFRDQMRQKFPVTGVTGGVGYISTTNGLSGVSSSIFPVAHSGTVTTNSQSGPKKRSRAFSASGHITTWTVVGTAVDLVYWQGTSTGTVKWSVDGGSTTNQSTVGGSSASGTTFRISLGTAGVHTVTVEWVSGTSYIEGLIVYNGDETTGVRVHEAGRSGFSAYQWDQVNHENASTAWARAVGQLNPHLLIIALGINDWAQSTANGGAAGTAADYKTYLKSLIADVRSNTTIDPSIMLLSYATPNASPYDTAYSFEQYADVCEQIAAEDAEVCTLNLGLRIPKVSGDALSLYSDTTHFTDKGHALAADLVMQVLGAGGGAGGGSSSSSASESAAGIVELATNAETATGTDTARAVTPANVASAYPLKSATTGLVDAAGDLLVGTADNTLGKLAKGTALQVLRTNAGATALEWATPSGGGGASIYGDGQDGNLTVSGTTTIATDKYYDTLIVQNGGVLKVAGARIFCKTLCQVDAGGVIHANGNDGAAGGTAGAATSQGMLGAEAPGGAGGTGAGSVSPTHSNAYGGNGGAGGAGSGGAGGAASGYTSLFGNYGCQVPRWGAAVMLGHYSIDAVSTVVAKGGGGGGGGGGDGTAGGGGGSGGGAFVLAAKSLTNNGTISANGGNGGSPAAGNRGGGGGGGGGYIGIVYDTKTGSGTITATAGTGGTHTGTGADGSSGSAGTVTQVVNV